MIIAQTNHIIHSLPFQEHFSTGKQSTKKPPALGEEVQQTLGIADNNLSMYVRLEVTTELKELTFCLS